MKKRDLAAFFARVPQAKSDIEELEEREIEVLSMLSQGLSGGQMCREMGIEGEELVLLKREIQKKLGLKNEVELVRFAARMPR